LKRIYGNDIFVTLNVRDPYTGRWGNQNMSFEDDKAVIHKMGQFGVCVLDPSRTLSLIPKVLRG